MLDAVDRFLGQGIEGIVVIATVDTAVAALGHVPPEVPLVAVGCGTRASVTSVAIDNAAGAAAATRYLLGLGHQTVYHVGGPTNCLDAKERAEGWRQALRETGAAEPTVLVGDWSASSGYRLGTQLGGEPGPERRLLRQRHDGARRHPGADRAGRAGARRRQRHRLRRRARGRVLPVRR